MRLFVWMYLERNTYTMPHVLNLSFIIVISKFVSVDVSNRLQEKNQHTKGISQKSVRHFHTNIEKSSNLSKEEFHRIIFLETSKV